MSSVSSIGPRGILAAAPFELDPASILRDFLKLNGSGSINAGVDGSATAQDFQLTPTATQIMHVHRLLFFIEDSGNFASGGFGALAALTTGLQLIVEDATGTIKDLWGSQTIKTNGQLSRHLTDVVRHTWASGDEIAVGKMELGGEGRGGSILQLDGTAGQKLTLKVADNLSGLVALNVAVEGWVDTIA